MTVKLIVTTSNTEQRTQVMSSGVEVLAEYPAAVLIRATEQQAAALTADGLETLEFPNPEVQTAAARFSFENAVAANQAAVVVADPNRTAYYLVQLVGPV